MKKAVMGILIVSLAVWMAFAGQKQSSVTVTSHDNSGSDDCGRRLQMHSSEFSAEVRGESTVTLPNQPLKIHAEQNGGIQVTTWDNPEFSIKLCKQVAANDESHARKVLDETRLAVEGSTVSVNSPRDRGDSNLGTLLIVKAPRNAQLSLDAHNGGISLRDFSGTAEARAVNGGVALKHSTGKLVAQAENGGVSVEDCSGDVTANVENGGLSISLADRWEGKGLEARTQNGGLSIAIPKAFSSGVEVTGSEYVSIVCRGDVCANAQRTWEDGRKIFRLGSGAVQVKATTVNGGIAIKDRGSRRSDVL